MNTIKSKNRLSTQIVSFRLQIRQNLKKIIVFTALRLMWSKIEGKVTSEDPLVVFGGFARLVGR